MAAKFEGFIYLHAVSCFLDFSAILNCSKRKSQGVALRAGDSKVGGGERFQ
jgi:hypothetical protein